ncbi:MAG: type II secretion system GspH family protein [Candidatus Omnitrophica bacterium]|nr:type II secretion system GspH family protein [Candidatus Omnitrophota bacterium]MCM8807368.1 type II secretion system GspH family protein [Candidatus Omnitrophota bacterium]
MKAFKKGFTFLEIMIAIGLFGIVAITCFSSFLTCLKNIKIVNDRIFFLIFSESKIQELKLENKEIEEMNGIYSDTNFKWEIELSDIILYDTIEEIEFIPYRLTITGPTDSYQTLLPFLKVEKKK